ncbi:MAG: glutamate racemase [Candidatus Moraniibacteriota bacterium]
MEILRDKNIGIFDSGFGGLNIMRGIVRALPEYDFVYLGDTARTPYGTRSQETIYEFTRQAVDFLFSKNCALIIFACNTASSDALRLIQQKYIPKRYPDGKALGVLIPIAEVAVSKTSNKRIGVVATESTVSSGAFIREISKLDPEIQVFQNACPLLVPLIESGEIDSEVTEMMLRKYLASLLKQDIDTLILGCTHYGLLENKIKKITGESVTVISEPGIVAEKLADYLERHPEVEERLSKKNKRTFYSTDLTKKFEILGSKFFGKKLEVEKANLEQ